jgi:hypothetical protein
MKLERKQIVGLLFIAVFVVYVLSPLMFPRAGNRYAGIIPMDSKTASSSKALHIFFEKLICFKFIHNDGKGEHSDSEIIIHKARTIITENKIVKLTLLHNLPVSEENHAIILASLSFSFYLPNDRAPSAGFHFLSSGLSPPAV